MSDTLPAYVYLCKFFLVVACEMALLFSPLCPSVLLMLATTTTQSASYHPFALRALLPSQTAGVVGADAVANIVVNTSTTAVPMTPASFNHSWVTPGQLPAAVTSSVSEKLPAATLYASSYGQLPAVVITAASAAPVDRSRPYAGQPPAVVTSPVDRSRPYSGQLSAVVLTADDGKEEVPALPELQGGQVCVY
jgi:hypothetical protein